MTVADKWRTSRGAPHPRKAPARRGECAARTIPSSLGRRRLGFRRHPQQQPVTPEACAAGSACAGTMVEACWRLAQTSHDAALAGQRVGGRPQPQLPHRRRHRHERRGSRPSFGQPLIDTRPDSNLGEILPYPHQRPPCRRPARKPRDNRVAAALCRPASANTSCVAPKARPPCHAGVGIGMPERHRRSEYVSPFAQCARCCAQSRTVPGVGASACAAPRMVGPLSGSQGRTRSWLIVHDMF